MNLAGLKNSHFSSGDYMSKKAEDKKNEIWSQVMSSKDSSGSFPGAKLAGIFVESMEPTFTAKGDAMPSEMLGLTTRTKYIHSVGAHGKVRFVSSGSHPYTGIFEGADHGIIRLSSAVAPTAGEKGQSIAPGMGLKFLRDGVDSANLVSMWSVDGQPGDWNFFSNDFFTHIGGPSSTATKVLAKKFATAT